MCLRQLWPLHAHAGGLLGPDFFTHAPFLPRARSKNIHQSGILFLTCYSKIGISTDMAFVDYIWLIKLIIELLKILGRTKTEDLQEIARGIQNLRDLTA